MSDWQSVLWVALACLVVGAWLALKFSKWRERRLGQARSARGKRGEQRAERLLIDRGYRVIEQQRRTSYVITADGVTKDVGLVLDFVVERNGEQLVAEVKTGSAADLSRSETRRQLMEYQLAIGGRCVLLVDPEGETITEVGFPLDQNGQAKRAWWPLPSAVLFLLGLAWWLSKR